MSPEFASGQSRLLVHPSESELRAVFDAATAFLGLLDPAGRLLLANRAALGVIGVGFDAVAGMPYWDTPWWSHHEPQREHLRAALEEARRGRCVRFDVTHRTACGGMLLVDFSVRPSLCAPGTVRWLVVEGHDVTAQRTSEAALLESGRRLRELAESAWRQANYDDLTGLPNRRLFRDRLEQALALSRRDHEPVALLFIDLDGFKLVNDLLGHDRGDELLVETARRISVCVRETDTVARLGGDEFTIILPRSGSCAELGQLSEHLLDALSRPYLLGASAMTITASIGGTVYPEDAENLDQLVRSADRAMYAAKLGGRNRFSRATLPSSAGDGGVPGAPSLPGSASSG